MRRITILFVLVSFFFGLSVADEVDSSCGKWYVVIATSLNVRLHPTPDSKIVRKIKKNNRVCAYRHKNEWIKIDRGWVNEEHVSLVEIPAETHSLSLGVFMPFFLIVLLFISVRGIMIRFKNRKIIPTKVEV